MAKNPTVSVIIPTHNRAQIISRAIRSVLNQTYQDFELIIVDDASIDNTEDTIKLFADERIRYIRADQNKGVSASRNMGIMAARGKYVAFLDDDDEYLPEKLEKYVGALENCSKEVGMIYGPRWDVKGKQRMYVSCREISSQSENIYKLGNGLRMGATLIRRECFDNAGIFDECLSHSEDTDLFIRLAKYYRFNYIKEPMLIMHYHPDSPSKFNVAGLSHAKIDIAHALEYCLNKHKQDIEKHKSILANYWYFIGWLYVYGGEILKGRGYIVKAVKTDCRIGYAGAALLSFLGQSIFCTFYNIYFKLIDLSRVKY